MANWLARGGVPSGPIDLSKLANWASKTLGWATGDFRKSAQQIASRFKTEERRRARAEREAAAREKKEAESSAGGAGGSSGIQEVEPWPQPVNLSQVLNETVTVFRAISG